MSAAGHPHALQDKLALALASLRDAHGEGAPFAASYPAVAVAYSGGLDSSVLLHLAATFARQHEVRLHAFHIHHGISRNADSWQQHCRQGCEQLGVRFATRHVALTQYEKSGIEEAARVARYHALGQLCGEHGVGLLLTAHHLDDQAETVLLQLLRGCGVAGMSGMETANMAPDLLGDPGILMARPLLAVSREELEQYASAHAITYVEDESNHDTRYARNALRHHVMPVLSRYFPGFQARFARTAGHAQSAQRLLTGLAEQDYAACRTGATLSVPALRRLDLERLDNLLRYWLAVRGVRMPSAAWLSEMRTQLLEAKADAQICVTHPDYHIRRYRDRVFLTPRHAAFDAETPAHCFVWQGQEKMHFPQFAGSLLFEPATVGFDADWLRQQPLSVRLRSGGEKLKPAWNRPGKSLKYHYQAMDIPAWERPYLPLIFAQDQLLFAVGVGMDCHAQRAGDADGAGAPCIALRWQAD